MFTTLLVIAIAAATIGAAFGSGITYLAVRPLIDRLCAELADASWKLTHDPLTTLNNRTGLQTIHTALAASGNPQPIAVILIDIDRFKDVNDTHSHDAGDELLTEVAARIEEIAEVFGGSAARLSGDEFAVVAPHNGHQLHRLAEMLTTGVAAPVEIHTDDGMATVAVTASLGIAVASSAEVLENALHHADTAMFHAKRQGGDRHVIHAPGMTMPARKPRKGPRPRDLHRRTHGGGQ